MSDENFTDLTNTPRLKAVALNIMTNTAKRRLYMELIKQEIDNAIF